MLNTLHHSSSRSLAVRAALALATTGALAALSTPVALAGGATPSPSPDGPSAVAGASAEQIAPLVQPSVVYELITWTGYVYDTYNHRYLRTDKPFTVQMQCTGFVVNPNGYVGTAGHCVDPEEGKDALREAAAQWALTSGYYQDPSQLDASDVTGDYRVDTTVDAAPTLHNHVNRLVTVSWGAAVSGVEVQKEKPAVVVGFQPSAKGDGALVKVDETDLNAIELADTSGVDINSGVVAVGYPAVIDNYTDPDLVPTFDSGSVSSVKTVSGGLFSVFQLSAQLSGGMSGGPAVDDDGDVIGVNSSHFPGEPFNYAVPADRIRELLAGAGVTNEVSSATRTYRDGIRAYFAGDRNKAVADLESVVADQPANGLATDYLKKARALPRPAAPATPAGVDWVLLAGVALAALLAVVGLCLAALAMARHRRPRTDQGPGREPGAPMGDDLLPTGGAPVGAGRWVAPTGSPAPTGFVVTGSPTNPTGSTYPMPTPTGGPSLGGARPTLDLGRYCARCGSPAHPAASYCGGCGMAMTR